MTADEKRKAPARSARQTKRKDTADSGVGSALRTVYEGTVSEAIPSDLLDLLNKLA